MPERKRPSSETFTAREVGALIEDLRAQFRTFGEGLEDIRGRLAALEAEVREFRDFASLQRLVSEKLRDNLNSLTAMSRKITADIAAMRDDFKRFEARVGAVEAKVGL